MSTHAPTTGQVPRRALGRASVIAVGALALATLTVVAPAQAAAPSNDTWQAATPVKALPFTGTVDTTEATPDAGFGRYRFHGVWYRLRLPGDGRVFLSLKGSDFAPQSLRVFHADDATDPPREWQPVAGARSWSPGSPAQLVTRVRGGENYFVMIGTNDDGSGGPATLTVRRPARLVLSLAPTGTFSRIDGSAVINGTLRSTRPSTVYLATHLRQLVNDRVVRGYGQRRITASTETAPWRLRISAGRSYKSGPARIVDDTLVLYDDGLRVGVFHFARRIVTLR